MSTRKFFPPTSHDLSSENTDQQEEQSESTSHDNLAASSLPDPPTTEPVSVSEGQPEAKKLKVVNTTDDSQIESINYGEATAEEKIEEGWEELDGGGEVADNGDGSQSQGKMETEGKEGKEGKENKEDEKVKEAMAIDNLINDPMQIEKPVMPKAENKLAKDW